MPNFAHRGTIADIIELDDSKNKYGIVFNRRKTFFNTKTQKKENAVYQLIILAMGRNASKIKDGTIKFNQRVYINFRIESQVKIWQGGRFINQFVVCNELEDYEQYKERNKGKIEQYFDESQSDFETQSELK